MLNRETEELLNRLKRGLSGYVSYLAACDMNPSFSEYILYEPALRILISQKWSVRCEVKCPGFDKKGSGDHKRLDFVAENGSAVIALEVKWAKEGLHNSTEPHRIDAMIRTPI